MAVPKIIADFETQLSTAIAIAGTSFSLASATDDDGVALPAGLYYFTLDNGTSAKEYLSGTLSGTSVTGVKTVSRQGVEVSGAARAHRVGASVILTDFATYKKYIDETTIAGASNATTSLQGLVELGTSTEIDSNSATGGTGAAIVVTPDQLVLSKYGLGLTAFNTMLAALTGTIMPYAGRSAPSGYLMCDGSAVSRTTYATLMAVIAPSGTFTVTIATPGVFSKTGHGLVEGDKLSFTTTGALPTGLATNTDYYVISTGLTADAFQVSASRGGAAVATSGSQNGTHTLYVSNYGKGDGSTTFNVPDMRGFTPYGYKSSDDNFDVLNVPNDYDGEKTHTLTIAEMPAHTHTTNAKTTPATGGGAGSSSAPATTATIDSAGGDGAHNNLSPYVVVNFIIKT